MVVDTKKLNDNNLNPTKNFVIDHELRIELPIPSGEFVKNESMLTLPLK
jgi:hypothetical protein